MESASFLGAFAFTFRLLWLLREIKYLGIAVRWIGKLVGKHMTGTGVIPTLLRWQWISMIRSDNAVPNSVTRKLTASCKVFTRGTLELPLISLPSSPHISTARYHLKRSEDSPFMMPRSCCSLLDSRPQASRSPQRRTIFSRTPVSSFASSKSSSQTLPRLQKYRHSESCQSYYTSPLSSKNHCGSHWVPPRGYQGLTRRKTWSLASGSSLRERQSVCRTAIYTTMGIFCRTQWRSGRRGG